MHTTIKAAIVTGVGLAIGLGAASALTVSPSQEFGKTNSLQVAPVSVTSFNQLTEPNDIQPATGYNMEQRTANPQFGR